MNRIVRIGGMVVGGVLGVAVLVLGGGYGYLAHARNVVVDKTWDIPRADFPIPFPLSDAEIAQLRSDRAAAMLAAAQIDPATGKPMVAADPVSMPDPLAGVDLDAIAQQRALERGKHLVESRLGCNDCHDKDFGGRVVVSNPVLGTFACPNITSAGVTKDFEAADWERIVRHGVRHDGTTTFMPAEEFQHLSDQELSDAIFYIRSMPPVDRPTVPVAFGPIYTLLIGTGQLVPAAYKIDHAQAHDRMPPAADPTVGYGEHLADACKSCHRPNLEGGPIRGGDPSWPPSANLSAIKEWTYVDFTTAMREGKKKDGTAIKDPMPWKAYGHMTDTELQALWAYIQTVPTVPDGV